MNDRNIDKTNLVQGKVNFNYTPLNRRDGAMPTVALTEEYENGTNPGNDQNQSGQGEVKKKVYTTSCFVDFTSARMDVTPKVENVDLNGRMGPIKMEAITGIHFGIKNPEKMPANQTLYIYTQATYNGTGFLGVTGGPVEGPLSWTKIDNFDPTTGFALPIEKGLPNEPYSHPSMVRAYFSTQPLDSKIKSLETKQGGKLKFENVCTVFR